MKSSRKLAVAIAVALAALAGGSIAQTRATKDIVLDRLAAPALGTTVAENSGDAMAVSVLVESPDGTLVARSAQNLFRTGERFRVKVLATRDGAIELWNTNPRGETGQAPIWKGEVKAGRELITPRMRLEGNSGEDQLHVVLTPRQLTQPTGVLVWLTGLLKGTTKDIRLDTQDTAAVTYVVNEASQGVMTTVRIVHQ